MKETRLCHDVMPRTHKDCHCTHELPALVIGESLLIQNQTGNHPGRWDRTGVVVDVGPGPRQYLV